MHNFRTNDENENSGQLWSLQLSLIRVKLHEIKSLQTIISTIKRNWKNMNSIENFQIPN